MITIDTKPTGETSLFIAANSIIAAIHTLDRARAALAALDDSNEPEPMSAEELAELIAQAQRQSAGNPPGQTQEALPPPMDLPLESNDPNAPYPAAPADALPAQEETPPLPAALAEPTVEELRQEVATVGLRLFGEAWSEAHTWLIALWTKHHTPDNRRTTAQELTAAECTAIVEGMVTRSQDTMAHWRKHLAEQEAAAAATTPRRRVGRQPRQAPRLSVVAGREDQRRATRGNQRPAATLFAQRQQPQRLVT